jgi:hypothetical protein
MTLIKVSEILRNEIFILVYLTCMVHAMRTMFFIRFFSKIRRLFANDKNTFILEVPPPLEVIIVPPPATDESPCPPVKGCMLSFSPQEEECETPRPLEAFCAVSIEIARKRAASSGLLVLFRSHERWDLFGRRYAYWAITPDFARKLLRCKRDLKCQDEFTEREMVVLEDLVMKQWIRRLQSGGKAYYFGLSKRTTAILQQQIWRNKNADAAVE